jgi:hypothetical protein
LLLTGVASESANAEPLGRLFHSAAERSTLDSQRKAKLLPPKPAASRPSEPPTAQLDGYVVHSDGKSTLWVNGSPVRGAR